MEVLCIGHAAYDITIPVNDFPVENTKNRVLERIECGGGPANNAAYLLGKWGIDTTFVGIVGNDEYGKKIKEELESVGVNTDYLVMSGEGNTTSSFVIANQEKGTRTILTYRPNGLKMPDIKIDCKPNIILIDGQEYECSKKVLKQYPEAISIIDAGRAVSEVKDLCTMVDYVVCSRDFAEQVTGLKLDGSGEQYIKVMRLLQNQFHTNIVVTLESLGCLYEYQNQIKIMPTLKMQALDTTGAGDIFHGAFTYAIANHYSFEDSLFIANLAGSLSVRKIGSKNSMPEKEEMKKYYGKFK